MFIALLYGKLRPVFKEWCWIVSENSYKSWMCIICGWIYEEEKGAPEEGLAPGTRWEDVPEYWVCPDCGAGKEDFEMIEI
jgi:rubredoxin